MTDRQHLPVPARANTSPEAYQRAPTLMAGQSAGSQGEVRVWAPVRRLLWLSLGGSILYEFLWILLAARAPDRLPFDAIGFMIIGIIGIVASIGALRRPCYATTDEQGIAFTTQKGSGSVRWADVVRCDSFHSRQISYLRLYTPEPVLVLLTGIHPHIKAELLSMVRSRCGLVPDPGHGGRYVSPFMLRPPLVPGAPIVEMGVSFARTEDEWLEVAFLSPRSPARDEGLRMGDRVVLINSMPTDIMDEETARAATCGPVGSIVTLEVSRPEWQGTRELRVRMPPFSP